MVGDKRIRTGAAALEGRLEEIAVLLGRLVEEEGGHKHDEEMLDRLLSGLHEADIADLLEGIPPQPRMFAWRRLAPELYSDILLQLREGVGAPLLKATADKLIVRGLSRFKSIDDVASVLRLASPSRRHRLAQMAGYAGNLNLQRSLAFAADTVGEAMDFDYVVISDHQTLGSWISESRNRGAKLPSHCDKLFVLDEDKRLVGVLPIKVMLLSDPKLHARDIMVARDLYTMAANTSLQDAAAMFERYDLVSAPVLDGAGRVLGRITIDEIIYELHADQHADLSNATGMNEEEDLFAPVRTRMANRAVWIMINLFAAFAVSQVVGVFEDVIAQVVALAVLMPVIASMAGNAGMQTASLVIRTLALNRVSLANWRDLIGKELALGCCNGALWGLPVGIFGFILYRNTMLAVVLVVAMVLVFAFASLAGFGLPLVVRALRGDPALGASVLVTTVTDCLSFFIFLGLASVLLI